ncbi:MAG: ATP-binding protein [Tissierellia bacterium]|nr:ATP-binding protein [Tissierellia bacterium]
MRIKVVTGHYGTGKTEFSVSLAMKLAAQGEKVALADLDIVNVYFRSRERSELLEKAGVRVISSLLGHNSSLDLPAISGEVRGPIYDGKTQVIIDVGGDQAGTNALVNFRDDLIENGYEMLYVINSNRKETQDLDGALKHLDGIEFVSGLKVTGLVVNTHLLWETKAEDLMEGYKLAQEVSKTRGLPIVYISGIKEALEGLDPDLEGERLEIGMYMREAWM